METNLRKKCELWLWQSLSKEISISIFNGLTNHIDKIGITWSDKNKRHLCHIMKVSKMIDFQIETFEELKQLVSNIKPESNEISIQEKRKRCFELANKLEKEITNYSLEGTGYSLYDVLFKLNNSVDEEEELLKHINNLRWINDIKKWKECIYSLMENGKTGPNSWAKWYILSVAKKQGISDEVIKKWRNLMDEAYKLRCNYEKAKQRYAICNCLLFEMQSNDEAKQLKEDLQYALREEPDAYNSPDNLPDDYFLIKSGIIISIDEFINIMKLCIKKKIYLCLDISKKKKTIIERLIGKTKFFEMIEKATPQQIKEIVDIDVKMDEICKSAYGLGGCNSTFDDFLYSSHNSKAVENIIACAVKDKESFLTTFPNVAFNLMDFRRNHLQISVETFEKFLSKCSIFSLLPCGNLVERVDALSICIECCSDDMKNNGKKIDLGRIFPNWEVFRKTMYEGSCWWQDSYYIDQMNNFFNLLFKNTNKIKLDDEQITSFLFGTIHNEYGYELDNFMDALRYEQEAATENNSDNELVKMAIVINAILKKQNLKYEDRSVQKIFEAECKNIGIKVSCEQDDVFFIKKTLYVVDKDTGVTQFNDGLVFCEYVYQNINTEKGRRYAMLFGNYMCENDYFNIYNYDEGNFIDDHYFFIICSLLNVLKNHNEAKAKIRKLYVDRLESKFQWLCFQLYQFFCFPFVSYLDANISQFYSIITFNDNKKNIFPSNQIAISKISTVPKSRKSTGFENNWYS